jgi:CheY-like chemotaxis protein
MEASPLRTLCQSEGLALAECYNGYTALGLILKLKPKVAVLDLELEGLSADKIIMELSRNYIFKSTSFILRTPAPISEEERNKYFTLGFDSIIGAHEDYQYLNNSVLNLLVR